MVPGNKDMTAVLFVHTTHTTTRYASICPRRNIGASSPLGPCDAFGFLRRGGRPVAPDLHAGNAPSPPAAPSRGCCASFGSGMTLPPGVVGRAPPAAPPSPPPRVASAAGSVDLGRRPARFRLVLTGLMSRPPVRGRRARLRPLRPLRLPRPAPVASERAPLAWDCGVPGAGGVAPRAEPGSLGGRASDSVHHKWAALVSCHGMVSRSSYDA